MEHKNNIGSALKVARKRMGLSQKDVARRSGVSANTVGAIEAGRGSIISLEDICRGMGLHLVFADSEITV